MSGLDKNSLVKLVLGPLETYKDKLKVKNNKMIVIIKLVF